MALEQLKQFDINNLYKVLKRIDVETLKHYNDSSVSDLEYFSYAIRNDIISNALNIVINYLSGNLDSCGVDMSSRTIIEALVILMMDKHNEISDIQKTIYRYAYTYVDIDNFSSELKTISEEMRKDVLNKLKKDKDKATKAMLTYFNCSFDELEKTYKNDPLFYLKKDIKDEVKISKLLETYSVCDNCKNMYDFFSIFIHPSCEIDSVFREKVRNTRKAYIDIVLNCVFEYLEEENLLVYDGSATNFDDDISNSQLYNNVHNLVEFHKLTYILEGKFCDLPKGVDWFAFQFLEKNKSLVTDMMISLSLGYQEHVISLFKSFIEEFSIYYTINSTDDLEKFKYMKKTYWLASRLQLKKFFNKEERSKFFDLENDLKELYENFYKCEYHLKKYKDFYFNLERNNLYCINKKRKNFTENVKKCVEEVFLNYDERIRDVLILYKISKDISHASGYSFNATADMITVSAHKTLLFTYSFLIYFIASASLTLNDTGIKFDGKPYIVFLKEMSEVHQDTIDLLYKKHDCK